MTKDRIMKKFRMSKEEFQDEFFKLKKYLIKESTIRDVEELELINLKISDVKNNLRKRLYTTSLLILFMIFFFVIYTESKLLYIKIFFVSMEFFLLYFQLECNKKILIMRKNLAFLRYLKDDYILSE